MNAGASEILADPGPLLTPVVLQLNRTTIIFQQGNTKYQKIKGGTHNHYPDV
jgi:hypothetical protein